MGLLLFSKKGREKAPEAMRYKTQAGPYYGPLIGQKNERASSDIAKNELVAG
jgi:hypothetical protein